MDHIVGNGNIPNNVSSGCVGSILNSAQLVVSQ